MQPFQKKRYRIDDYISTQRANPIIQNFSKDNEVLHCICKTMSQQGLTCFKCKEFTHSCIINKNNRQNLYECSRCLNKALDPLYQVKKVLVQSYFRTFSIFSYSHLFSFEFNLCHEDLSSIVEIRGIIPGSTNLSWPMQGGFSINEQKHNFHELKPLLTNSNRKARREEYFTIPADKLKLGRNFIRFRIPCLDRKKFTANYQFDEKQIYYFGINLVNKLTPGELESQTFRERRTTKQQSLQILQLLNSDIEITQNKVCLMCPYSKDRIKVPIRGRYCQHFSCICLQTLIASHSSSRYWSCPLCDHRINEPCVDVWIYQMLIDNQKGSQVMIRLDGTYEWVKENEERIQNLDSDSQQSEPYRQRNDKMDIQPPVQKKYVFTEVTGEARTEIRTEVRPEVRVEVNKAERKEVMIDIQDDIVEVIQPPSNVQPKIDPRKRVTKDQPDQKAPQNKEIEKQPMVIQQNEELQREAKKKEQLNKMKQRMNKANPNAIIQSIIGTNNKAQTVPKPALNEPITTRGNSLVSFQPKYQKKKEDDRNLDRSKSQISHTVIKKPVLYDIKNLQARQLRPQEFKRMFSKDRTSKYKKYAHFQEIRRLFKQIL